MLQLLEVKLILTVLSWLHQESSGDGSFFSLENGLIVTPVSKTIETKGCWGCLSVSDWVFTFLPYLGPTCTWECASQKDFLVDWKNEHLCEIQQIPLTICFLEFNEIVVWEAGLAFSGKVGPKQFGPNCSLSPRRLNFKHENMPQTYVVICQTAFPDPATIFEAQKIQYRSRNFFSFKVTLLLEMLCLFIPTSENLVPHLMCSPI